MRSVRRWWWVTGLWLVLTVGCGTTAAGAGQGTTPSGVALPQDPLWMVPASSVAVARARTADLRKNELISELLDKAKQWLEEDSPESPLLELVLSRAQTLTLGMAARDAQRMEFVIVLDGDFTGWQKHADQVMNADPRGGWSFALDSGESMRMQFFGDRRFVIVSDTFHEAMINAVEHADTALMARGDVIALRRSTDFERASIGLLIVNSEHYMQLLRSADDEAALAAPLFEQLVGGVVTVDIGDTFMLKGMLRTRADAMAAFLLNMYQQTRAKAKERAVDGPARLLVDRATAKASGPDILMSWHATTDEINQIIPSLTAALMAEEVGPATPADELAELQSLIPALRENVAKSPLDAQAKATLGWALVRTGETKEGVALLLQAPLEPDGHAHTLFPGARSLAERRALQLATLAEIALPADGLHLVLGHILLHHIAREEIADPELSAALRTLASTQPDPLVYLDALSTALYHEKAFAEQVQVLEKLITELETRKVAFPDNDHQSHYYYNVANALIEIGELEQARVRLATGIKLNPELYQWALRDDDFKPLREHIGEGAFRQAYGPKQ